MFMHRYIEVWPKLLPFCIVVNEDSILIQIPQMFLFPIDQINNNEHSESTGLRRA